MSNGNEGVPISRSTSADRGTTPSTRAARPRPASNTRSAGPARPARPLARLVGRSGSPSAGRRSLSRRSARLQASSVTTSLGSVVFVRPSFFPGSRTDRRTTLQTPVWSSGPTVTLVAPSGTSEKLLASVRAAQHSLDDRRILGRQLDLGDGTRRKRLAQLALGAPEPVEQVGHHDRKRRLQRQVALVQIDREHDDFPVAWLPPAGRARRTADLPAALSARTCAGPLSVSFRASGTITLSSRICRIKGESLSCLATIGL